MTEFMNILTTNTPIVAEAILPTMQDAYDKLSQRAGLFNPFSSTRIEFASKKEENNEELIFGKLQLCVNEHHNVLQKYTNISFYMDNSASMAEPCADGNSKMHHTKLVASKIITHFQENNYQTTISVNSFNEKIKSVIKDEQISSENVAIIIENIVGIRPNGSTNIEAVLTEESKKEKTQDVRNILFLFTDGEATCGRTTDTPELIVIAKKILNTTIVTVGCGLDHDAKLLKGISSGKNNINMFAGKVEESGLACGEALSLLLGKVLENVVITVQNGEIYDWENGIWCTSISAENIISERDKFFNVRSQTPEDFSAHISAMICETGQPYELSCTEKIMGQDLRKYEYRQATLELLFKVTKYNDENNAYTYYEDKNAANLLKDELKTKMGELLTDMKKFMTENGITDDKFMRMLCDDLVVCYKTLGTAEGAMFSNSRQTTQGTQGIFKNTLDFYGGHNNQQSNYSQFQGDDDDEEEEDEIIHGGAINASCGIRFDANNECDEEHNKMTQVQNYDDIFKCHKSLNSDDSPYAELKTVKLMRYVSGNSSDVTI